MATEVDTAAFTGEEEWGPPTNPPNPSGNVRIVIEGGPDEPLVQALTSLLIVVIFRRLIWSEAPD